MRLITAFWFGLSLCNSLFTVVRAIEVPDDLEGRLTIALHILGAGATLVVGLASL